MFCVQHLGLDSGFPVSEYTTPLLSFWVLSATTACPVFMATEAVADTIVTVNSSIMKNCLKIFILVFYGFVKVINKTVVVCTKFSVIYVYIFESKC